MGEAIRKSLFRLFRSFRLFRQEKKSIPSIRSIPSGERVCFVRPHRGGYWKLGIGYSKMGDYRPPSVLFEKCLDLIADKDDFVFLQFGIHR